MGKLKNIILGLGDKVEDRFDSVRFFIKRKLNLFDPIQIVPYNGYGTAEFIYLKGRVLEDKGITSAKDTDSKLRNIINMYKRLQSDEIPGAKIEITIHDRAYHVVTDEEGYFDFSTPLEKKLVPAADKMWHEIDLKLIEAPIELKYKVETKGRILIPPPAAQFGIISDIDDTVLESNATSYIKAIKNTFVNNSRTRLPFEGVAAFYKALQLGAGGSSYNPIFYVSSGLWNLYDLLVDFFEIQGIPPGPVMLQDYGIDEIKLFAKGHKEHKYLEISRILATYPEMQFVLIGDSGQQDAHIYSRVIKDFPGRILAAYIRDVKLKEKAEVVLKISEEIKPHNVDMVLIESTVKAAEHAAEKGLITRESLDVIAKVKKAEEKL